MSPYAVLGAVLLVVATFFFGQHQGRKLERTTWQAAQLKLEQSHRAEMGKELAARKREREFQQAVARKATERHEQALTDLQAHYDRQLADLRRTGGLRIPASVCPANQPTGAGQAAGASGPDASGAGPGQLPQGTAGSIPTIALPEPIEQRLTGLTRRGDELAEQLRALQQWVRDNGFYGPPEH